VASVARAAGAHPQTGDERTAAAVDSFGPRPCRGGRGQDRARADLRGRVSVVQFRVPPEAVDTRCAASAHRLSPLLCNVYLHRLDRVWDTVRTVCWCATATTWW
jgi:hypothetical protein